MVVSSPLLVGRERARATLRSRLDDGILLVSGTGGAGIGVTALARRVAMDAHRQYPDGVIEVNLRGGRPGYLTSLTPDAAQRHVLRSLNPKIALPEDGIELRKVYQATVAESKALLILDDAASAAQLRHLLPRNGCAAIVTSQVDLAASLPKLHAMTLPGLSADEAYHLIIQVTPEATRFPRAGVHKLATYLRGVPLALRIVAPLLGQRPLLSPRRAIAHLDEASRRIIALRGTESANTRVDAAIEVAYELLDYSLKQSFEALAIFPAAFDVRAAASVWDVQAATAQHRLDRFGQLGLIDHRLEAGTYEIHQLVRLYAQELLVGQPEWTGEVVSRYVAHYLREAIQATARLDVPAPDTGPLATADLVALWEHVTVAWTRAVGDDAGWPQPQAMDRWICDFPHHSMTLLAQMLSRTELLGWLTRSLDAAESVGDARTVSARLGELGRVCTELGAYDQALDYYRRQLDIARESEALDIEGEALMYTGFVYGALGNLEQAAASWQRSLRVFNLSGDPRAARVYTWLQELQNRSG